MIDSRGYRPNVGIILTNEDEQVFWGKRTGQAAWQFPQGGIKHGETPEEALFRELYEEVGLLSEQVEIIVSTRGWLHYRLPKPMVHSSSRPVCIGQKQKWFLLRMKARDSAIRFDAAATPEFDDWKWVSYWYPLRNIVAFKRDVYRRAMRELSRKLFVESLA